MIAPLESTKAVHSLSSRDAPLFVAHGFFCVGAPEKVTKIFWSSKDRVRAPFHSVESRQNKPKANHGNFCVGAPEKCHTEITEITEKILVKDFVQDSS